MVDLRIPRIELPDFNAFPVNLHWRQDSKAFPACWILIGQSKFWTRQPYARNVVEEGLWNRASLTEDFSDLTWMVCIWFYPEGTIFRGQILGGSVPRWIQWKVLISFRCCCNYRSCAKIKQEPGKKFRRSNLWYCYLATSLSFLSHFSCPDNVRPNIRSRRLVVAFPAKANLLALTIFKQRFPISGLYYNSTVK